MVRKVDIAVAFIFGILIAIPLSLQFVGAWTGTQNTLSDGYLEVANVNATNYYFGADDENLTAWVEGLIPATGYVTADYVITVSGGNYYAYNGTGSEVYSGAVYSTVMNSAIDSLPGAGEGTISLTAGTFTQDTATVGVGQQTRIIGSGIETTTISVAANVNAFTLDSCVSGISSWAITHMTIDMNDYNGDAIHGDYSSNPSQAHSELGYLFIKDIDASYNGIYLKRPMDIHGHDIRIVLNDGTGIAFESVSGDSINWGNSVWENIRIACSAATSVGIDFKGTEGSDILNLMHFFYVCIIGGDHTASIGIRATGTYWTTFYGLNIEDVGTGVYLMDAVLQFNIYGNYIASCTNHSIRVCDDTDPSPWVRSCEFRNCKLTSTNEEYVDYSTSGSVGMSDSYAYNYLINNRFDATPQVDLGLNTYASGYSNYNEHQVVSTPFTTGTVTIDGNARYVCSPDQGSTGTATSGRKYLVIGRDIMLGVSGGADVVTEIWEFDQSTLIANNTSGFWHIPVGYIFEITWTGAPDIFVAAD